MDAAAVFARAALYTDEVEYILIRLPAAAITPAAGLLASISVPFSALVADKDEVTLVLPQAGWEEFQHRLPDRQEGGLYRLITFDLPLAPDLVGFMALVSRVLADAGVSILPIAAFERDHLLVPVAQFRAAWDALEAARQRTH